MNTFAVRRHVESRIDGAMDSRSDADRLADLIQRAEVQAAGSDSRTSTTTASRTRRLLGGAALLVLIMYLAHVSWSRLGGPTEQQTAQDLEQAVQAAGAVVEDARRQTGKLPDVLPRSELASVVQYEPAGGSYTLSATILGVRVTLQSDGTTKTETGVPP